MAWTLPRPLPGGGWGIVDDTTGKTYDFDNQALAERTYNILTGQSNDGRGAYVGSGFRIAGGTALLPYQTQLMQMQRQREQDKYLNLPRMETEKQTASWNAAKSYMDWLAGRERATGYISGGYAGGPALDDPWLAMQRKYAPTFGLGSDYRTPEGKQFTL